MEENLSNILLKLSHEIIKSVTNSRNQGEISKLKRLYIAPKIEKFEYKEGSISCQTSYRYIEKEEWHWKDEFKLMDNIIKKLPTYDKTFKVISKNYDVNENQAEFWLSRFSQILVRRTFEEEVKDETVVDLIVTFIADLEGSPKIWKLKVWLNGIWMKTNEIEIVDGIKIRKPEPSDFEFERPFDMILTPEPSMIQHPSAILEIVQRAKIQPYIYDELEKLIITFRLYKIGSVFSSKTIWNPKSVLDFGGTTYSHQQWVATYKYPLNRNDLTELQAFIGKIKSLIPIVRGILEVTDNIGIALQRYNDAILKPQSVENRVAYSVMGLEALYLKSKEREELAHRLAQRVSKTLNFFDHPPIKVYNIVKEAYGIRSDFVHGSPINEYHNASKLVNEVLEYLRISLLIFMQLRDEIGKDKLLSLIDNAMLEEQAIKKLQTWIKNLVIPKSGV